MHNFELSLRVSDALTRELNSVFNPETRYYDVTYRMSFALKCCAVMDITYRPIYQVNQYIESTPWYPNPLTLKAGLPEHSRI